MPQVELVAIWTKVASHRVLCSYEFKLRLFFRKILLTAFRGEVVLAELYVNAPNIAQARTPKMI